MTKPIYFPGHVTRIRNTLGINGESVLTLAAQHSTTQAGGFAVALVAEQGLDFEDTLFLAGESARYAQNNQDALMQAKRGLENFKPGQADTFTALCDPDRVGGATACRQGRLFLGVAGLQPDQNQALSSLLAHAGGILVEKRLFLVRNQLICAHQRGEIDGYENTQSLEDFWDAVRPILPPYDL